MGGHRSKYDGWQRVFPHPLNGRLVEKQGWPVGFASYFTTIKVFCHYELEWRDPEAQVAYYRAAGFEAETVPVRNATSRPPSGVQA